MKEGYFENLGSGIYCIDARYVSQGVACCYLMVEGCDVAIIETGTAYTADAINEALLSLGLSDESVRYIIPTHVHLDHAGGAGVLMQRYPEAQLVIHPRGARHMINPTQLIAGSKAVYGEEKFTQFYGEIVPVSEGRVHAAEDGEKLNLNGRVLEFRHTPGHAEHHFCIWDAETKGWFSGDTFGISYQSMGKILGGKALEGNVFGGKNSDVEKSDRFIIPTTSPVQFNPDRLLASIDLMMSYDPERFYLTHYSVLEQPKQQADLLRVQIEDYRKIALSLREELDREKKIYQAVKDMTLARIATEQPTLDIKAMEKVLEMDFELNAQGLNVWLGKQKQQQQQQQQ
ncbi:MAG: MBL fold metallo-hydrolase, partial [Porticoccus sp.]|nr:MBL fold metallo-hydrolase [Porticoccus sp.]